jgi:hypothetical protein
MSDLYGDYGDYGSEEEEEEKKDEGEIFDGVDIINSFTMEANTLVDQIFDEI